MTTLRRRQVFLAICAECGKETKVIFQPRGDRPVYCSKCFDARRRGLAGNRRYRCGQCGKYDYGNYFKSDSLCKKCAAKRPNLPVELADQLVITTSVQKQLRKKAEMDVPRRTADKVVDVGARFIYLPFWLSAPFVSWIFFREFSGWYWLFFFAWALALPYAVDLLVDRVLAGPREKRREQISTRIIELAQERRARLEEQQMFYSSPEWKLIRGRVIQEEGRVCAICGRRIDDDVDITVDHKYPRNKYPELALSRDNLRVVCRQCNSQKGARDWVEW